MPPAHNPKGKRLLRRLAGPSAGATRSVVCLPYAGASASSFRLFASAVPSDTTFLTIQLPGRQDRFTEQPFDDLHTLIACLAEEIAESVTPPMTLFGHSMGALLSWGITHRLAGTASTPDILVLSGSDAPHTRDDAHSTPVDDERELMEMGGVDPALIADPRLRDLVFKPLRSDLRILGRASTLPQTPVAARVHVLGGSSDKHVSPQNLAAWRDLQPDADLRMLDGGHFFIWKHLPLIVSLAAPESRTTGPGTSTSSQTAASS
jgi:surfactin synthase thioesterase subunit